MNAKIVSKLSVKSVFGNVPTKGVEVTDADGNKKTVLRADEQNIMRLFGKCEKTKAVNTAFGESTAFIGQFRAINLQTGETFQSTKAFLPPVVAGLLASAKTASEGDIEFALDIGVKSCNNAHGYEYTVVPLHEPAAADPLEALAKSLPPLPEIKAIAAPAASQDAPAEQTSQDAPAEAGKGKKK